MPPQPSRPDDTRTAGADAPPPLRPPEPAPGLPIEQRGRVRWLQASARTLALAITRPSASFRRCPEPIAHGRVLGYLATLRLPAWALLVGILAFRGLTRDRVLPTAHLPIHSLLDPALTQALSTWLVLMVPVGLPLLYFLGGLVAHVGIALTGGAPRSIGTTMRAVGYALGPVLLAIAVLDLPLYLARVPGFAYVVFLGAVTFAFLVLAGIALARTHQMSLARGFLVALLPALVLAGVTLVRAALVLDELPGLESPDSPYYVP